MPYRGLGAARRAAVAGFVHHLGFRGLMAGSRFWTCVPAGPAPLVDELSEPRDRGVGFVGE